MSKIDLKQLEDERKITPWQQAAASCTGAVITSVFVTPLDVVKIRLQAQKKQLVNKCFLYCNGLMDHVCDCGTQTTWFERRNHFNGTMDAFYKISKYEGVTSLWSGLSPTLVLAIPATILYFVSYEQLRLNLRRIYNDNRMVMEVNDPVTQPSWIPMMSGATARIISATAVSPLELIRTKMQSTKLSYFEVGQALKSLVKNDGVFGLWKGVTSTLLRDVPFSAFYWMTYEQLKNRFAVNTAPSFGLSFMCGALAGSIAAAFTVPFDVVKTHQQIELGEQVFSNQPTGKQASTFATMMKIHNQFGMKGLFTGIVPRLIKVTPACAIMIATFEHGKIFFYRLGQEIEDTQPNL